ncbi:cyclodeaminase/cyclohydrolase family protein [Actinomycetospora cinnamomea]|uniref:Cyclodeaminase/cyclohydrolase domain-containing protein n=1 Tax=Actinomycetospora cinnamomea TaxID=663609 RepID=A0A2U1EAX7_9PSEU|nr:cyclodeaminase/cyclohydrolase family protein [Actinomycetospora cinnamomea]PVY97060.1 hypothetical protein C8D89_1268 [Actinomycetospora cinnamomea]
MRSESVEQLLEALRSPDAGPGGGVGVRHAALHAGLGAALVARVARSRDGDEPARVADELCATAVRLVGDGGGHGPDGAASVETARVAVRVLEVAERALRLLETLRPLADRTAARAVLPEVAAAAEALRAAVGTARVDVEIGLAAVTDPGAREELLVALDPVDDVVLRAAKVTAVVREQVLR